MYVEFREMDNCRPYSSWSSVSCLPAAVHRPFYILHGICMNVRMDEKDEMQIYNHVDCNFGNKCFIKKKPKKTTT